MSVDREENLTVIDRELGRSVFGGNADTYDRARSGYPEAVYARIAAACRANPRVFEIGAGTGLATEGLLSLEPERLVSLEPDRGMADVLARRLDGRGVDIVCGPFPETRVDGCFDLVACAAAFHWLPPEAALAEIDRLLAKDGIVAIWWNSYFAHGLPDPFGERMAQMLAESGVVLPPSYENGRHYAFDVDRHRQIFQRAGFGRVEHNVFSTERRLTSPEAQDLYRSFSFIELMPSSSRQELLASIEEIVDIEFGGSATCVCATSVYIVRR